MGFRVTIQVTCDTIQDAQGALARLGRTHKTWDEQVDEPKITTTMQTGPRPANTERLDKIMEAPARKNISPGEPSIGKIGKDNVDMLVKAVMDGNTKVLNDTDKWQEHLKLLWKRGLVKFDGEEYYL